MPESAQTKMKALVMSRLLLGDIDEWPTFERERATAEKITNRHIARSVAAQIGRTYTDLSNETRKFIAQNFTRCDYGDLAKLCDAIEPGVGLHLRLDEFERSFFPLNRTVKDRFPFYAHISISTYGLQFEFPEHHFIRDLEAGFTDLKETRQQIQDLVVTDINAKGRRSEIAPLVGREKFISRSMVSAAFSLVEAFISGLFYTALNLRRLGNLPCDDVFLHYAKSKESSALKGRIDAVVKFASQRTADGTTSPFKEFIEIGKHFRDAIHHTTPFERKDLNAGQRLDALYNIKSDVAVVCALLALDTVITISAWLYGETGGGEIAATSKNLKQALFAYSIDQGLATIEKS